MPTVGNKVRELRGARGWTQVQLGVYAGISPSTVNLIEHGHRNPNAVTLQKLAHALGVEPGALFAKESVLEGPVLSGKAQAPPSPETSEEERRCLAAALDPWANIMDQLSRAYRPRLANLPEAPPLEKLREYQWVVDFTLVVCARIEAQLSDQSFQEVVGPWVSRVDAKEHVPPNILEKVNRYQGAYTMLLVEDDAKAVDWVQRQKGRVHEASTEASAELLGELERFLAANDPPIKRSSHRG